MAKKQKAPDSGPSKAYLVSFGDTMTALLAFFIVINSLSKEQTGANLYSGTGSFVNAVSSVGMSGNYNGDKSRNVIQKDSPTPIYALSENLDKNGEETNGPDEVDENGRTIDRDKENFQRFIAELERQFGLEKKSSLTSQIVFDSFESFNPKTGLLSQHALHLAAETIPLLSDSSIRVEVVLWAKMPSPRMIGISLDQMVEVEKQIQKSFFVKPYNRQRLRFTVKPWLFSDAKRPVISFVVGRFQDGR